MIPEKILLIKIYRIYKPSEFINKLVNMHSVDKEIDYSLFYI